MCRYAQAGDEPGYRKTNQDTYAVHEKFASTAGSFFAVFDGHGPNGRGVGERLPPPPQKFDSPLCHFFNGTPPAPTADLP